MLCAQQLLAEVTTEHLLSIKNDLDQPIDTAIASNGDIYSLNGGLSQVVVFDEKGRRKNRFGRMGKGDGGLDMPVAISISIKREKEKSRSCRPSVDADIGERGCLE